MRIRNQKYTVDWLHLSFVMLIVAAVIWFWCDARGVSLSRNNLLLLQPLAACALLLCAAIVPQCFRHAGAPAEEEVPSEDDPLAPKLPRGGKELLRVCALGAALGLMVFSLNVFGFDIALWLFAAAAMAICGERRPLPLTIYPLAVTIVAVYGFRAIMSYPMITFVL